MKKNLIAINTRQIFNFRPQSGQTSLLLPIVSVLQTVFIFFGANPTAKFAVHDDFLPPF